MSVSQSEAANLRPFGPYLLLLPLDSAGPRPVSLVAVQGSDRPWALKKLMGRDVLAQDKKDLEARVRAWGRAGSRNLADVLEVEDVGGETVVVMEYVQGVNLAELHAALGGGSGLPIDAALHIAREVAEGLARLHTVGEEPLTHGNVSPRSTLISYDGRVKLGALHPSPAVPPPVDGASLVRLDLLMLGRLLRWTLTGESYATAPNAESASAGTQRPSGGLRAAIPREVEGIVQALLGSGPVRFSSATDVARALGSLIPSTMAASTIESLLRAPFGDRRLREAAQVDELVRLAIPAFGTSARPAGPAAVFPAPNESVGQYEIVRAIGQGGMGRVFEAVHRDLGRRVALKVLSPSHRSPVPEERFRREARATQHLDHPNLVAVTDFGTTPSSLPYLVMEYVDGITLHEAINQTPAPFPIARALHVAHQVCDAVALAHTHGVVHRDIKPANVMLVDRAGDRDFVKVLDFGLAKLVDANDGLKLTAANQFCGTVDYAAPEQLSGVPATASVDVYAVGELLYEMLTKARPHDGDTEGEVIARKLSAPPTPIVERRPDLPEPVARMIMKALASRPEDRQPTMKDLQKEVEACVPLGAAGPPRSGAAPKRQRLIAAAGGGAVALTLTLLFVNRHRPGATGAPPVAAHQVEIGAGSPIQPAPEPVKELLPAPQANEPVDTKVARSRPRPAPAPTDRSKLVLPTTRAPSEPAAEGAALIVRAEAAFEDGRRVDAISLAKQAVRAGAGAKGHLALAKYYQSMRLPAEAAREYREVLKVEPHNQVAVLGLEQTTDARPSP